MTQTPNFSEQHTYYDGTEFLVSVEKKQKKKKLLPTNFLSLEK